MAHVLKRFRQDILTIFFFGVAIFMAFALASFKVTDPSFNSFGSGLKAQNLCGLAGSFLADLFYQSLGMGAWLFVAFFLRLSFRSARGFPFNWKQIRYLWASLLVICVSTLLAHYFPERQLFGNQIYVGGILGVGLAKILTVVFNSAGIQVFLWSIVAMLVVFFSERTLGELGGIPGNMSAYLSLKTKEWWKGRRRKETSPQKETVKATVEDKGLFVLKRDSVSSLESPSILSQIENKFEILQKPKNQLKARPPRQIENWEMPKLTLLQDPPPGKTKLDKEEVRRKAEILTDKMRHFAVEGEITDVRPGPLVTMFEFKPNADVKLSKITELQEDLSLALSSESLRVIAPIPGRDVVGIETSNSKRDMIFYKDLLSDDVFWQEETKLPLALGRQVNGDAKIVDLRKMPHLLVAGTTGSGKSVFITSVITGLLFRHSPKTLRLLLIDPKQVDLAAFQNIPHLLMPPVTEPRKAVSALKWAIREMEKRYKSMSRFSARGLEGYNEAVGKLSDSEKKEHEKINQELESGSSKMEQYYFDPLPYIVIVVEEFGDLMSVDKQNVEQAVVRLAQMARACGIHLILAMQSPRKEVVTGLIKTNIPGRIALKVASKMDSRIILDDAGAERLLPNGDMLFLAPGISKPARHHGPYLSENEMNGVAEFWAKQAGPDFDPLALKYLDGFSQEGGSSNPSDDGHGLDATEETDDMYNQILNWAVEQRFVSASLIQRRFRLGYPRAARIIEVFEKEGVVGPANGSKPRQVLISKHEDQTI